MLPADFSLPTETGLYAFLNPSYVIVLLKSSCEPISCNWTYDRPDQLQRPRTPDLENSRKTDEKGAEWDPAKVPGKQPKNSRTGSQTAGKQLFCILRVFFPALQHLFRRFVGCFQGPAFMASVTGRADRKTGLLCVKSQHHSCETKTSLASHFEPIFCRCFADVLPMFCRCFTDVLPMLVDLRRF